MNAAHLADGHGFGPCLVPECPNYIGTTPPTAGPPRISTTYHLARTMEYEGYLQRRADGCYRLGPRVAELRAPIRVSAEPGRQRLGQL